MPYSPPSSFRTRRKAEVEVEAERRTNPTLALTSASTFFIRHRDSSLWSSPRLPPYEQPAR